MFIGHYGAALALKRAESRVPLAVLVFGATLLDVLWSVFILTGWEHAAIVPGATVVSPFVFDSYPISHSLLGAVGWALAAGIVYLAWPTSHPARHGRGAAVVAIAVLSHYALDAVVHVPDLTLAGAGTPAIGLGLWNHRGATMIVEFALLGVGALLYATGRSRKHPLRPLPLAVFLAVLALAYLASVYGPPPPGMRTVAIVNLIGTAVGIALAAWVDRPAPAHPARR